MPDSGGETDLRRAYFRANLRLIGLLLAIWAFVSFGCGILLAPWLNGFMLPFTQYPLGFWFAQQGSIYVFVVLILVYVVAMNRLDRRYGVDEEAN
ncbi:MAG: DUF4212 domain-containing protein [Planctomycetota bacterium]|nr:DUF4212 domain-containing protein [Planctomycetota bacterium]